MPPSCAARGRPRAPTEDAGHDIHVSDNRGPAGCLEEEQGGHFRSRLAVGHQCDIAGAGSGPSCSHIAMPRPAGAPEHEYVPAFHQVTPRLPPGGRCGPECAPPVVHFLFVSPATPPPTRGCAWGLPALPNMSRGGAPPGRPCLRGMLCRVLISRTCRAGGARGRWAGLSARVAIAARAFSAADIAPGAPRARPSRSLRLWNLSGGCGQVLTARRPTRASLPSACALGIFSRRGPAPFRADRTGAMYINGLPRCSFRGHGASLPNARPPPRHVATPHTRPP